MNKALLKPVKIIIIKGIAHCTICEVGGDTDIIRIPEDSLKDNTIEVTLIPSAIVNQGRYTIKLPVTSDNYFWNIIDVTKAYIILITMTVDDVKLKKAQLECKLYELISEFEDGTGAMIREINEQGKVIVVI